MGGVTADEKLVGAEVTGLIHSPAIPCHAAEQASLFRPPKSKRKKVTL